MLDLPENFEAYKMNCIEGNDTVGILCRRPDGGTSDMFKRMNRIAVAGICPACGRDMNEPQSGTFACANGHILVVMTTDKATAHRKSTVVSKIPSRVTRRIIPKRITQTATLPPAVNRTAESTQSVEEAVRKAMKEAGI